MDGLHDIFDFPPLLFQDTMSRTQLHYVLRSYLANPLGNSLASFVDNCESSVNEAIKTEDQRAKKYCQKLLLGSILLALFKSFFI